MAASHYETLGVAESAPAEEVRRAYIDLARRLHPDRWVDASPAARADTERRMQQVNEAWRVLGDARRRRAYDAGRHQPGRSPAPGSGASFAGTTLFGTEADEPADLTSRLIRALPWALLVAVLGAIFVFTAYAADDTPLTPGPDRCVRKDGNAAVDVPCDTAEARRVVAVVASVGQCPPNTEAFQPDDLTNALCLER